MDLQIKNCPFCNSPAELFTIDDQSDYCFKNGKLVQYYDVRCKNEECYLQQGAGWYMEKPDEIIELWNKRNKSIERENKLNELGL